MPRKKKGPHQKRPGVPRGGRVSAKAVQQTEDLPFVSAMGEPVGPRGGLDDEGLCPQWRMFAESYVQSGDANKAAEFAGYNANNRNAVRVTSCRLLHIPAVQQYVAKCLASKRMTSEWVENRLTQLASSGMENFLKLADDGKTIVLDLETAARAGALGQLKKVKEKVLETNGSLSIIERTIETRDPFPALQTLAKRHGLVQDKVDLTSGGEVIEVVYRRAGEKNDDDDEADAENSPG